MEDQDALTVAEDNPRQLWVEAFDLWLQGLAENTRRTYTIAWKSFLVFTGKQPWEIGKVDVAHWVDELRLGGGSVATVAQRVAAVSSFYQYVREEYEIVQPDGRRAPLFDYNPARSKNLRGRVNLYGKATALSAGEARALLAAIPRETMQGKRDYALVLTYLATGRRNSEIRLLRWGDFEERSGKIWYRWSGKRKADQLYELPRPAWDAIIAYLESAGRMGTLGENDYIFTAKDNQPLSAERLRRLVKRYARRAGLDPTKIKVHTLRHTAAMLRKESGDDLEEISHFLGHSSIAGTLIYMHRLEGKRDSSWGKVEALLGL